ncbi:putative protein N(5)-glutamine methyltransferase [Luedemannella helvata]|uniref:peptide chain release factor N(5)-glutamine methyltransferase n=1 Tax=Luedemannella helvata TaxID=349315 RepID=A0ABP4W1G9_9ACTN
MSVPITPSSLTALVARLRAAGCVFAEDEAALLVAAAASEAELDALSARRIAGEPLEHVIGWVEFRGLRVAVEPGVFVPRQRTAFLVDRAAAVARPGSVVVDLCCGAGAIGAALADAVPGVELYAADIDPAAVRCARRNLAGVAAGVFEGDLFEPLPAGLRGRVDVLVANVPYVPSDEVALMPPEARDHEPRASLDGGADGLDVLRRLAAGAGGWLAPGGHLLVEAGERQAPTAVAIMAGHGLRAAVVTADDEYATVVVGQRSTCR